MDLYDVQFRKSVCFQLQTGFFAESIMTDKNGSLYSYKCVSHDLKKPHETCFGLGGFFRKSRTSAAIARSAAGMRSGENDRVRIELLDQSLYHHPDYVFYRFRFHHRSPENTIVKWQRKRLPRLESE